MIDKIVLNIPTNGKPFSPSDFSNLKITFPGQTWKGIIKGKSIHLKQCIDRLVITANLPKILNGENINPLSRKQVKESCDFLESLLHIDLKTAIVRYVEVGTSIITKEPPGKYLSLFGDHSRLKRNHITQIGKTETVLYFSEKGSYSFSGYDKMAEVLSKSKEKQMSVPLVYQGQNVLRLELKIKKSAAIRKKFGQDLYLHDLYDHDVYTKLKNLFHEWYLDIPKTGREVFFNAEYLLTCSDINNAQAMLHRQLLPDDNRILLLAVKPQMTDYNFKRTKDLYRKDYDETGYKQSVQSIRSDLIAELDSHILGRVKTG